ncbi:hypothetical protein C0989_011766, partial [Termitomyces sp. Mn162]
DANSNGFKLPSSSLASHYAGNKKHTHKGTAAPKSSDGKCKMPMPINKFIEETTLAE